jgi:hypothetical protein
MNQHCLGTLTVSLCHGTLTFSPQTLISVLGL